MAISRPLEFLKKMPSKNLHRFKKILGILLGLSLIVLFLYITNTNMTLIFSQLSKSGVNAILLLIPLTILVHMASAIRWKIVLNEICPNTKILIWDLLYYISVGYCVGLLIPQAASDYGVKGYYLKSKHNIPLDRASFTILMDQIFSLIASLIFIPSSILFIYFKIDGLTILFITISLLLIFSIFFIILTHNFNCLLSTSYIKILNIFSKIKMSKMRLDDSIIKDVKNYNLKSEALTKILFISLVRQVSLSLRLYVLCFSMNLAIPFSFLFFGQATMCLLAVISIVPGQLGIGELAWYGVMRGAVPDETIASFAINARILSDVCIFIAPVLLLIIQKITYLLIPFAVKVKSRFFYRDASNLS